MTSRWDAVPEELKERRQWVVWKYEDKDGRRTKVPYQCHASQPLHASSTDPTTWGEFGAAITVHELCGYDGIGIMLDQFDPYVGLDLDHCIRDGITAEWAQALVDRFASYTEVTPSGQGLRIFIRARWPEDIASGGKLGRRKGDLEVYSGARFLTITGRHIPDSPEGIEDRGDELAVLHWEMWGKELARVRALPTVSTGSPPLADDDIMRMAAGAANGPKFRALWRGEWESDYGSQSEADLALASILAFYTQDTAQLERLIRQSGLAREKWSKRPDYRTRTLSKAISDLTNTWTPGGPDGVEVKAILKKTTGPEDRVRKDPNETEEDREADRRIKEVYERAVAEQSDTQRLRAEQVIPREVPQGTQPFHLTDLGNGERLVARHGHKLRYCGLWRKWLVWDGRRWQKDDTSAIERMAKETVRSIYTDIAGEENEAQRKELTKFARASESDSRIKAMIERARAEDGMAISPDQLDREPWLLTCLNGTVDLRTGELRPHSPEDMITKLAPVVYEPGAVSRLWARFLSRVFSDNTTLIDFMQRAAGYSLSGSTVERVIFITYGTGRNGKSTYLETMRAMLGDYAMRTPTDTLMLRQSDRSASNDIARLKGARFVTASETREGRRLDEELIKDVTGGDTISARFLHAEFFDFTPECKIWLSTNHKPVIRGTDMGIWDRIRLIPFEVRIPDEEVDRDLREKLIAELPGIFAWAVRGCLQYRTSGLSVPDVVADATNAYRTEMDILLDFLEDCCTVGEGKRVPFKDLYAHYVAWCKDTGEREISQRMLALKLQERGFQPQKSGAVRYWVGLELADSAEQSTLKIVI